MRSRTLALLLSLAPLCANPAYAARINCKAHPFDPRCCPSPCPVNDAETGDGMALLEGQLEAVIEELRGIRTNTDQMRDIIGKPQNVNGPLIGLYEQYPALWQQATKGGSQEALEAVRRVLDSALPLSPQLRGMIATPHTWMQSLPKATQVIDERVRRGPHQPTWYSGIDIDVAQTLQRSEQERGTVSQGTGFGLEIPSTVPNQPQRDEPWKPVYGAPVPVDPPTLPPLTPQDRLHDLLDLLAKLAIQLALAETANSVGTATADLRATQQAIGALVSQLTGLLGQTYENPNAAAQALIALAARLDPTRYTSGFARDAASVAAATEAARTLIENPTSFGTVKPIVCDGAGADKVCGTPMASPEVVMQILAELRNQQKYAVWVGELAAIEAQTRSDAGAALIDGGGTPSMTEFQTILSQALSLADQISPATAALLRSGSYILSLSEN